MALKETSFWRFFCSVRLTLFLLVILAALAVIGTLIPQREDAVRIVENWNPTLVSLLFRMGLFDLYHSLLFRLLLLGLCLNLTVCSLDRLPKSLRLMGHKLGSRPDQLFERPLLRMKIRPKEPKLIAEGLKRAMKPFGGRPVLDSDESRIYASADYGRLSYLGVYLVHASVLIILIGGLLGSFLGFEGYVNIPEGESVDTVEVRDGQYLHLGFSLRCDRFKADFYPNGTPKEYRSTITVLSEGRELLTQDVLVNQPLEVGGITFYQASYGTVPISVEIGIGTGASNQELRLRKMEPVTLENGIKVEVLDIKSNFMGRLGPAALLRLSGPEGSQREVWIFKDNAALNMLPRQMKGSERFDPKVISPYKIELKDLQERHYTGLQVAKDPGTSIVWVGCALMILGFFVTFFYPHRQLWIRADIAAGNDLRIVARTNKDPAGLEVRLRRLMEELKKDIADEVE